MKRYLPFFIVIAVGLIAFGSAIAFYRAERPILTTLKETGEEGTRTVHVRGNPKAKVTLEEFGDYQCPPCGKLAEPINQLEKAYRPNLRVIFRNFPLPLHAHARQAAEAAEAAGLQGKFWEMHDLLYREQAGWSKAADVRPLFISYAGLVGLDVPRFEKDLDGEAARSKVTADQKYGSAMKIQNTPTIFLNNRSLDPKSLNPDGLREAVEAELKKQKKPGT
jgi:protein-disulfide isomerase